MKLAHYPPPSHTLCPWCPPPPRIEPLYLPSPETQSASSCGLWEGQSLRRRECRRCPECSAASQSFDQSLFLCPSPSLTDAPVPPGAEVWAGAGDSVVTPGCFSAVRNSILDFSFFGDCPHSSCFLDSKVELLFPPLLFI